MKRVLVTDGEQRAALAVVRSLGRAGYRVYVCASRSTSLAGASRYAERTDVVPDPLREPRRFADAVRQLIDRWQIEVLIPVTDAALLSLLPRRDSLGGVLLPFPDARSFERASDKALLMREAAACGIPTPPQVELRGPRDPLAFEADSLGFPLVLKPARSVVSNGAVRQKLAVGYAGDAPELRTRLEDLPPRAYPILLQRRLAGPGLGIFVLRWQGRMIAAFGHRRLREKPPSGGVSVYCESIALDEELLSRSTALLDRLGWEGVAMVEYKLDAASGVPYLMEVNPRFWGSLQLAIDAGVDFPALLLSAAAGDRVEPVTAYRVGVRSRWWWGEVDHVLARFRGGSRRLAWRAVRDFAAACRPGQGLDTLRLEDPRPFLRESLDWVRRG